MTSQQKILFTGHVGAGKTTAIQAISDIDPVSTEANASDEVAREKATTTVAMDYGTIRLDNDQRIHLYGTPGQERFRFMWDILAVGGLGLIVLIDNTQPSAIDDLESYLSAFPHYVDNNAVAIGITRMDLSQQHSLEDFHRRLLQLSIKAPIMEVDARASADVALLLQCLLYHMSRGK